MRPYVWTLLAVIGCCLFAMGGFAVGAYMQFLHTVAGTQDIFVRDITTAKSIARNECPNLMEWVKLDVPVQYVSLTEYEKLQTEPLPVRLTKIALMTWSLRSMPLNVIRSSDRWQRMMRDCDCGLEP